MKSAIEEAAQQATYAINTFKAMEARMDEALTKNEPTYFYLSTAGSDGECVVARLPAHLVLPILKYEQNNMVKKLKEALSILRLELEDAEAKMTTGAIP